jgi:hypothetical protein
MSSLGIEVCLGADFHKDHDLSARYATGEAWLTGVPVIIYQGKREGRGRLRLSAQVVLPPSSWTVANTYVEGTPEGGDQVANVLPSLLKDRPLVLAHMVVDSTRQVVPIELINIGDKEIVIPAMSQWPAFRL